MLQNRLSCLCVVLETSAKEDAEIVGENSPFSFCIVFRQFYSASRGIRCLTPRGHGSLSAVVPSVGGLPCCQSPPHRV